MNVFTFNIFNVPPPPNKIQGAGWERMKKGLVGRLMNYATAKFNLESGASGRWQALSPATIEIRQKKVTESGTKALSSLGSRADAGSDIKILQDSGLLRSSFTGVPFGAKGAEGMAQHEQEILENEVAIMTNVEYARIQNDGGVIQNGFGKGIAITIPARPYDEFSEDDRQDVQEYLEHYLNG